MSGLPRGWAPTGDELLRPLIGRAGRFEDTGFDLRDFADSVWILHPMWERQDGRAITVFDDSLPSAPDRYEPLGDGFIDYGNAGKAVTAADRPAPGWPRAPGAGYCRLRWQEYAERHGVPMVEAGAGPGGPESLPGPFWGQRWNYFDGPREGTLDVDTWRTLIRLLQQHDPHTARTGCTAFYTPWAHEDLPSVLHGPLSSATDLPDWAERDHSPQNLWPDDLSWLVYTDYDSTATLVSGSQKLVRDVLTCTTLEASRF